MNADSNRYRTPQWLPSLVRQPGQLILAIPVSCLVASLTAFGWLQYKTTTAEDWVQHSQHVRLETKRLLTALLDAETEVRGYELTRRPEFLKRYDLVRLLIPKSLEELQQLVADNPVQTQQLQQIQTSAQARMSLLERNLQLVKAQPENLSNTLKLAPLVLEGQQTMDKTRLQIDQFLAQEERLQAERDKYLNRQRNLTWLVLGVSAAIGIGGSLFAAYLLNRLEKRLSDRDRILRESEARYRAIAENFPNGAVLLFNSELRYLLADGAGMATVGVSKEQIEGKTIWECLPEDTCVVLEPIYRQALAGTVTTTEISYSDRAYIVHTLPMRNSQGNVFAGMVVSQDITELKASQAELHRVNRALKTLSECNQTLVRATEESTLLQNICQNIVDFGGYHSVWIGYAEQDEAKTVRPVAQVGFEQGYLESQQISWCPSQNGSSPVGTAIRTKSAQIFQNVLTDPNYSRWREAAVKRGYASSITLPLLANEQPLGVLSIYATDLNAFDEAEVKLLIELTNDLVYGITALRTHSQRQQAEAALQESQQRLDSILSSIEDVVWSVSATTYEVLYINQAAEKVYGRSITEFYNNPHLWLEVVHPEDQERVNIFNQSLRAQGTVAMEYRILRSDGEVRWLYDRGSMTCDTSNRAIRFDGIVTDITERKQAEALLRDSEAKFRAFLESASEAIIVTNAKGEIVMFNAKAEELFGYDRTEVLGRTVELLMPERYRQIHPQHRTDYQAHPVQRSMSKTKDLFAQRKNGTEFPVEAGLSSIQTKNGTFVITFLTDITERKRIEEEIRRLNESLKRRAVESETRYQQIVELAEEGIWVINAQGKTTYVNHALTKMLGYTDAEMLGRPISDFISQAGQEGCCSLINFGCHSRVEKCEQKLITKSGKDLWVYMSASPALDENGEMAWSCILVYNITARKQAEEQLRSSSDRISLANAELARATRLKDEFLAGMSHELRTPLNAILGLSEALQEEVYGELTAKQRQSLATIEQSGRHLLELINDILDLSKIESGKMELQLAPIGIEMLCESSLTFVRQQAHKKAIRLSSKIAKGLGDVEVDERRMRQVLVNLLSNAVKFTPESGEVRLEVGAGADGETLQLSVIDTGIGIAPENLDKLFQPFMQLDSSLSRRYAGTGLGLALVRRIVELHDGSIRVESQLGKGSCFTVTVPWQESAHKGPFLEDRKPASVELPIVHRALIVEDSEPAASHIARYLAELGTAIKILPQGEGTLETALQFKPDVIILDILLPHLSGWDVLQDLKTNQATQLIPVLVASVVDEQRRALELGASECLLKPISRSSLHSALSRIVSSTHFNSEPAAAAEIPQPLVLLAEDNEANISTLMDYLQVQDFRVILARNGIEAVQVAKQQKPDLILMDIQMPEMDGLEATRRIRAETELANIPIIALTALAMPGDRDRCLAAGANDYMTKPVSLKKLMSAIAQYIVEMGSNSL